MPRAVELDDPDLEGALLTWAASRERNAYLVRSSRAVLLLLGGAVLVVTGLIVEGRWTGPGYGVVALGAAVAMLSAAPYLTARSAFSHRTKALASARVDQAIVKVVDTTGGKSLPLEGLFELNRRQLDEYQEMTKKQQRSAFTLMQIASIVAFLVLVAGVIVAVSTGSNTAKYISGGLTGLGSALSSFLAATFYKAYRDANQQLNRYYLEPQRTGRVLAAERLVREWKDSPKSIETLVAALMAWEMPVEYEKAENATTRRRTARPRRGPAAQEAPATPADGGRTANP